MEKEISLKGKIILITGGSLGLGYAVAEKCSRLGAQLILASRTEKDLKKAAEDLKSLGGKAATRVLDVSDKNQVKETAGWVDEKFGKLDGLVNCAGIYGPIGRLDEIDIDRFIEAIQINFLGTVFTCHYFARLLFLTDAFTFVSESFFVFAERLVALLAPLASKLFKPF